ncbi:short-chain dehydrogenase/reductase [Xylaria sp. FL0043]|nr:short-chain dehydrogenase/reductase [Xylaria sp. FL0043]
MVDFQTMISSNSRLSTVKGPIVALFVGATSGIGLGVLREFARQAVSPRIYFVARNPITAAPIADELRILNPSAKCEIIHRNVSLIKDAEKVAEYVKAKESSLDLLFMSPGFVSLDGRQDTAEGLDASMTTRYYSRIRIAQLLLPLLNKSRSPRVVSILAGGREGPVDEDDLALKRPGNFSMSSASYHSCTMNTLMLERLATENPRISFIHAFPGVVDTPLFDRLSSGIKGTLLSYTVVPVARLFARSVSDAGHWGLFISTSARYSVDDGMVPLSGGMEKAERTKGGIFLVNEKGDATSNERVLGAFRRRGLDEKVWAHTNEVFASIQ